MSYTTKELVLAAQALVVHRMLAVCTRESWRYLCHYMVHLLVFVKSMCDCAAEYSLAALRAVKLIDD